MKRLLELTLGLSWFAVIVMALTTGDKVGVVLWLAGFAFYLLEYNGGFNAIRSVIAEIMRNRA